MVVIKVCKPALVSTCADLTPSSVQRARTGPEFRALIVFLYTRFTIDNIRPVLAC